MATSCDADRLHVATATANLRKDWFGNWPADGPRAEGCVRGRPAARRTAMPPVRSGEAGT